jgi:hypothetical protein
MTKTGRTVKSEPFTKLNKVSTASQLHLEALFKNLANEQKQKAKQPSEEEPLPDLTPKPHLVAFIDILGFRLEIESARTAEDFHRIYKKLYFVQQAFENPLVIDMRKYPAPQIASKVQS